jgi:hypothetical protein
MGHARAGCRRYRAALTAFAAHREGGPATRRALDHVDRCRACADELQELALAVIALRRLGHLPEPASISAAAWARLRDRIERNRASAAALAWRWRTTLAGVAAGTLVVAALVAPQAVRVPLGASGAEPTGLSPRELDRVNRQIEQRYIFEAHVGAVDAAGPTETSPVSRSQESILRRYPDDIKRDLKEVDPRPTRRPPIVD